MDTPRQNLLFGNINSGASFPPIPSELPLLNLEENSHIAVENIPLQGDLVAGLPIEQEQLAVHYRSLNLYQRFLEANARLLGSVNSLYGEPGTGQLLTINPLIPVHRGFADILRHAPLTEQDQEVIEAYHRAWELLQQFLTDEQKAQVPEGFIIEAGNFGTYRIPLKNGAWLTGLLKFTPTSNSEELDKLTNMLVDLGHKPRGIPTESEIEICVSETGMPEGAPWHDAVLTLLLHIRAGKEDEIWKRAGLINGLDETHELDEEGEAREPEITAFGCLHAWTPNIEPHGLGERNQVPGISNFSRFESDTNHEEEVEHGTA